MDALVAAFVAGLLLAVGDRTTWLAAILADRYRRPGLVLIGAAFAFAGGGAIAAVAGTLMAPFLTPNARALLLGIALVLAGLGGFFRPKRPEALAGWRTGALLTPLLGLFILAFGERTEFVTAALAARSPLPALAGVGGALGALVGLIPAVALGERGLTALPLTLARIIIGIGVLLTGLIIGLGALRLL